MPASEPWTYALHIPQDDRAVTVCRRTVRLILTLHGLIRTPDLRRSFASRPLLASFLSDPAWVED